MGRAIGIDLGTTNSVAAIKEATVKVLQNRESQDLTPSVVGLYKKEPIVGQPAIDRAAVSPKDTIYSVKRLMGRGFRDAEVQKVRETYQYEIVAPTDGTDQDVRVLLDNKPYSPPQISATILKKIKEDAEVRLNDQVEYAVITVPAYFTEKQKDATRKAGQLAGLKVQKILDEPTAAAIAFGVDNVGPDDSKTILVYDLGGGTFDVSVLTIVGGIFAQLNIEGNMWLGGDDFDRKIMDHVLRHIETIHGIDARKDSRFMIRLKEKAEQAKKGLSAMTRSDITIPAMLKDDDGDLIDVEVELSRAEFEKMIAPQVAESIELVKVAIKNAGEAMTPEQIDHVLLVGGSSYIPLIRKSLAAIFGEQKLLMSIDPMKCVAFGAAVLAAKWVETVECPKGHTNTGKNMVCDVCGEPLGTPGSFEGTAEVTGMHYGIQAEGDRFAIVIQKGSSFPTPEAIKERFVTPRDNLKRIRVPIYAGFDSVASKNEWQATVWLELPERVPVATPLEVAFKLDSDGILEKVAVSLLDGSGAQIETYLDRGDSMRSQLEKKLEQLKQKKDECEEISEKDDEEFEEAYGRATKALSGNNSAAAAKCAREMEAILARAGGEVLDWEGKANNLASWTDMMLGYSFLLDPPRTQQIKTLLEQLRRCVDRRDSAGAEKKFTELDKATDDLPDPMYVLLAVRRAIATAFEKKMEVEASQLRVAVSNIESAMRNNDQDKAFRLFNEAKPVISKVDVTSGQGPKRNNEALVQKA